MDQDNEYLEKAGSLLAGASATHLAQNVFTNAAMKSKGVAKYLANSFSQGYHGVVDKSVKAGLTRGAVAVTLPDVGAAHKVAHGAGEAMREILSKASLKQKLGVRMISEGRFADLQKHGLDKDPVVQKAHALIKQHLPTVDDLSSKAKDFEKLWKDKSHPLLSNIAKGMSRGEKPVGKNFKPGSLTQTLPTAASVASGAIDPAAGILNTAKSLSQSKALGETAAGRKFIEAMQKQFIKNPISAGLNGAKAQGAKFQAYKFLVNPTSAHLKRTSAALKQITGN